MSHGIPLSPYRPDIDGLRAIAILPVIWFHSGLSGLPGGFTGVDTFFVISGYLITGLIFKEISSQNFSFRSFYARRVRRLAPALLVVICATMVAGLGLMLPWELEKLGASAVAAISMFANIHFWREAGYFALGQQVTPLLHTWSLAVEEQFYIFFPLTLILAHKYSKVSLAVIAIAVLSFVLSVYGMLVAPAASFYLLPTRAWELMIGASLALGIVTVPAQFRAVLSTCGLLLVLASAFFITESDPFPGWLALFPTTGAFLIIGSGPDSPIGRLLSAPVFVWIGKISYPLYLWHWPVFAFIRHYNAEFELPAAMAFLAIALSILLSWLTYRYIETPLRKPNFPFRRLAFGASAATLCIFATSASVIVAKGYPGRFDPDVLEIAEVRDDLAPLAHSCVNTPLAEIDAKCHLGPPGSPSFVIWGDSHAAANSQGVARGLAGPGLVASMNTCPAALGWASKKLVGRGGKRCAARNQRLFERISKDPALKTVVLSAYWPSYERDEREGLWRGTNALAKLLRAHGKKIIILAGTPEPGQNVPWSNAVRARFDRQQLRWTCPAFDGDVPGVTVIDLSAAYCADRNPGQLFTDNNHPSSTAGLRIVAPAFDAHRRKR